VPDYRKDSFVVKLLDQRIIENHSLVFEESIEVRLQNDDGDQYQIINITQISDVHCCVLSDEILNKRSQILKE
jgi:hypothetical protein